MAALETVATGDLRRILAEVDDADAIQRLMAAIVLKEIDDRTQEKAATLYGFPVVEPRSDSTVLERFNEEPFKDVVSND